MCLTLLATHVAGHLDEARTAVRASEAAAFQSALGEAAIDRRHALSRFIE